MIELALRNGRIALVDADDLERLSAHAWYGYAPSKRQPDSFYAMAHVYSSQTRRKHTVWMHRFLLNAPKGVQVDHINGNGLDNRRSNLRLCTQSQNNANIRTRPNSTGFRGVFATRNGTFRASISTGSRIGTKSRCIGTFGTAEEAARAYDAAAIERFGEFAYLNFPLAA